MRLATMPKFDMGNGYSSIFTRPLTPTEGKDQNHQQDIQIQLRLRHQKHKEKYKALKKKYAQCKNELSVQQNENLQMNEMVLQQKQIFEEYTQKVSAVMQQLEIENSDLKQQVQSYSELRAQMNSSKQNVAKILEDTVLEKKRADHAQAKNKEYKVKLSELIT